MKKLILVVVLLIGLVGYAINVDHPSFPDGIDLQKNEVSPVVVTSLSCNSLLNVEACWEIPIAPDLTGSKLNLNNNTLADTHESIGSAIQLKSPEYMVVLNNLSNGIDDGKKFLNLENSTTMAVSKITQVHIDPGWKNLNLNKIGADLVDIAGGNFG